jgi:sugar phosphate permease
MRKSEEVIPASESSGVKNINVKKQAGTIVALMVGYSMVYMDKNMVSTAIIPIAKQFNLTASKTGLIMSAFFLGYSLMQIPGGWLADKIGPKKVLMMSLGIISLFSYAFGMVSSLMLFMCIRFCAGIGHGGYPPSCTKTVALNFDREKRTAVQSLILSTSGIGGILAFTIGANVIAINWRYAYLVLGTFFLVAALLVWLLVPAHQLVAAPKEAKNEHISFKKVITNRNVLILFVAMLLINLMLYGIMSWNPTYLQNKFGLSMSSLGMVLAFNSIFTMIATMSAGVLLTKLFLGKEKLFLLGSTVLCAALMIGFVNAPNLPVAMVLLFLSSMVSYGAFTAIFTWPHKIMHESIIGSAIGIINTGGTLGGFFAPMIIGGLVQSANGSFTGAFIFIAIASLLSGICTQFVKLK